MNTKKFLRDAADLLGFPWSAPVEPVSRSSTSTGFVESVCDADLLTVFRRNAAAHTIVEDVANDAVSGFVCESLDGEVLVEFSGLVEALFVELVEAPLIRMLSQARLYGYCGLLVGYADGGALASPVVGSPKILYVQPIPKKWVSEIVYRKDAEGNTSLPLAIDHYSVLIGNVQTDIDGSRIIHMQNQGMDEDDLLGESALLCIFDDLTTMKSMSWGAGQAMWRNGGGLTVFIAPDSSDPQTQIDAIDEVATDINAMTVLTMPFGTQVASGSTGSLDPRPYFDTNLEAIAIGCRIPVSILRGSTAGALSASEKDRRDYHELLSGIQKNSCTPVVSRIIRGWQASGQLPVVEFLVVWNQANIWMVEEQKAKLFEAQVALTEARTVAELGSVGVAPRDGDE